MQQVGLRLDWRAWLELLVRFSICLVFIIAAVPKLADIRYFGEMIRAYEMLPDILILPTAVVLPVVEVIFAVGLWFRRWWGMLGIGLLLVMFIVVLSMAISAGLDIDCGCFGPEDPEHKAFSGLRVSLGRDIIMLLGLAYMLWFRFRSRKMICR